MVLQHQFNRSYTRSAPQRNAVHGRVVGRFQICCVDGAGPELRAKCPAPRRALTANSSN